MDCDADWPDGCRVIVEPLRGHETFGLSEEDWDDSPEAISAWLRWYDSLEPLDFSPEEQADWTRWRNQLQVYERSQGDARFRGLFE
ncbi:MAG: hypothetical protein FJ276_37720 [Planctomycetes bacterium]|nr:hypothetical protein [Planctomycetota bacterium]